MSTSLGMRRIDPALRPAHAQANGRSAGRQAAATPKQTRAGTVRESEKVTRAVTTPVSIPEEAHIPTGARQPNNTKGKSAPPRRHTCEPSHTALEIQLRTPSARAPSKAAS